MKISGNVEAVYSDLYEIYYLDKAKNQNSNNSQFLNNTYLFLLAIAVLSIGLISFFTYSYISNSQINIKNSLIFTNQYISSELSKPNTNNLTIQKLLDKSYSNLLNINNTSLNYNIIVLDSQNIIKAKHPSYLNLNEVFTKELNSLPSVIIASKNEANLLSLEAELPEFGTSLFSLSNFSILDQQYKIITFLKNKDIIIDYSVIAGLVIATILLNLLAVYLLVLSRKKNTQQIHNLKEKNSHTIKLVDKALEGGHSSIWNIDLARGYLSWSSSMPKILGKDFPTPNMSFKSIMELIHPDDLNLLQFTKQILEKEEKDISTSFRMKNANDDWVWFQLHGRVVENPNNHTLNLICIVNNIDAQKSVETEIGLTTKQLISALNNLPDSFILWDKDKNLICCNQGFGELYNLKANDIKIGTSFKDISRKIDYKKFNITALPRLKKKDNTTRYEVEFDNGQAYYFEEQLLDNKCYLSIGTNITHVKDQKRALEHNEIQLKQTISELKESQDKYSKQAKKLEKLANDNAKQLKIVAKANTVKRDFLTQMSHNIRTPLNAIIGFSEVIEKQFLGPVENDKYLDYASDIHKAGNYLLEIITDVLEMAALDKNETELKIEKLDIGLSIREALKNHDDEIKTKNIEINNTTSDLIHWNADIAQMKCCIDNIIHNAIKYSPHSGEIKINAEIINDNLEIKVTDKGIGISKSNLKLICEPFTQINNGYLSDLNGSGLGLSITHSIIKLHGGELVIDSNPNKGTTAIIRIPTIEITQEFTQNKKEVESKNKAKIA